MHFEYRKTKSVQKGTLDRSMLRYNVSVESISPLLLEEPNLAVVIGRVHKEKRWQAPTFNTQPPITSTNKIAPQHTLQNSTINQFQTVVLPPMLDSSPQNQFQPPSKKKCVNSRWRIQFEILFFAKWLFYIKSSAKMFLSTNDILSRLAKSTAVLSKYMFVKVITLLTG